MLVGMVTAWLIAPPSQISTFHIQMETRRREWGSSTRSVSSVNPPPPPPPSLSLGRGSSSSVESVQYLTIRLFSLETKREKERTRERFLLFSLQVTKCASVSSVSHRADVRAGVDGSACTHFHVHDDLRLALAVASPKSHFPLVVSGRADTDVVAAVKTLQNNVN